MNEGKRFHDMELDLDALRNVTGGVANVSEPVPTGSVRYECTVCGAVIDASTRDMTVTCPNLKCRCQFQVRNGKLTPVARSL